MSHLIAEQYVLVKLTVQDGNRDTPGAEPFLDQMGGAQAGLPFYVFLDPTGSKIADSCAMPGGQNIGHPGNVEELKAFDSLLERTAPRMARTQRDLIMEQLRRNSTR